MIDVKFLEQNAEKTFDEIIAKPDNRKVFVEQIGKLASQKATIAQQQEVLKDDVSIVADAFKLSKTRVNSLVDSVVKGTIDDKIADAEVMIEVLQIFSHEAEDDE
ncbi:Uncharacterised protein [Acinetobacter phage MD-2021a]|nr:Uncharacterised protein [Acinetobacter phage MD-2021a]CAH1088920.1 Uncharacterised protein [Acinetobacter phage MD-2021a]